MKLKHLETLLRRPGGAGVDTSILIYHLQELSKVGPLASAALEYLAEGKGFYMSTLSLAEMLVKPYQSGTRRELEDLEQALLHFPGLTWVAPDYHIARDAARLRATHALRLPDAVILATALRLEAKVFLTNDRDFRKVRDKEKIEIAILEDYLE